MTSHLRRNGSGSLATTPISPWVYAVFVLLQLICLGSALLTRRQDVGHVPPGLLRAGASLMGMGFALTLGVDRGRFLFSEPAPSRLG